MDSRQSTGSSAGFDVPRTAAVVGAGAWGTTIASVLAEKGMEVSLWVYEGELCETIRRTRENALYLPGIPLSENIRASCELGDVVVGQPLVVLVTPSQVLRRVAAAAAPFLAEDAFVVSCSKGIEQDSLMLMSQVLDDVLGRRRSHDTAFVSGPSFALEVARRHPTSVAVAAWDMRVAEHVRRVFQCDYLTLYANPDVIGIEVCGAVKNVIAIAVGICAGLGFGHNTQAAVMTRGLGEMMKLGTELGANPLTFTGLAGFGDLVLTCTADLSRNRTLGERLGRGESLAEVVGAIRAVAEGVDTAKSVRNLALKHGLDMPICNQVYKVLFEQYSPRDFVLDVISRDKRNDIGRVQLR